MKRREKYLLLKQKMREDPELRKVYFEEDELEILLITNDSFVIAKRKAIARIIKQCRNRKLMERIFYTYFSKKFGTEVSVRIKTVNKKRWRVVIKYRKKEP